jgi:hypothetical protein
VVSEESGHVSLVERGRVLRALDEERLRTALRSLLRPSDARGRAASSVAKLGPVRFVNAGRHRRTRLRMKADLRTGADGTPVVPVAPNPPPPPGTPPGGAAALPGSAGRAE